MRTYKVTNIINEEDIPKSKSGVQTDYSSLFDQFDRISKGKTMVIEVEKNYQVKSVKKAFTKKYGKSAFRVTQRTKKTGDTIEITIYLTRKV